MIQDNQWHPGIVYKLSDGTFAFAGSIDEGTRDIKAKGLVMDRVEYNEVQYNWNRGQPILDFGDFQMSIVDMEIDTSRNRN